MKATRIISLLLAFVMLCGAATFFSSCNKAGDVVLSKEKVGIDLEDYIAVYPDSSSDGSISFSFREDVSDLVDRISDSTGVALRTFAASNVKISHSEPAILIGNTG